MFDGIEQFNLQLLDLCDLSVPFELRLIKPLLYCAKKMLR